MAQPVVLSAVVDFRRDTRCTSTASSREPGPQLARSARAFALRGGRLLPSVAPALAVRRCAGSRSRSPPPSPPCALGPLGAAPAGPPDGRRRRARPQRCGITRCPRSRCRRRRPVTPQSPPPEAPPRHPARARAAPRDRRRRSSSASAWPATSTGRSSPGAAATWWRWPAAVAWHVVSPLTITAGGEVDRRPGVFRLQVAALRDEGQAAELARRLQADRPRRRLPLRRRRRSLPGAGRELRHPRRGRGGAAPAGRRGARRRPGWWRRGARCATPRCA